MKTENTKDTPTAAKPVAKIKTLKLAKETVENLSDQDAAVVKGGGYTNWCGGGGSAKT